jgi:hypothetical protein
MPLCETCSHLLSFGHALSLAGILAWLLFVFPPQPPLR